MAIATSLAILGAAGIGAVASSIGSSKQAKAAKDATQITQQDNAANRAFQTEIYNKNYGLISPYQQAGVTSNNAIMELLGFPAQQQQQQAAFGTYGASAAPSAFSGYQFNPANDGGMGLLNNDLRVSAFSPLGQRNLQNGFYGGPNGNWQGFPTGSMTPGGAVPGQVTIPQPNAQSAFDTYRNSTGYQFRFNEGLRGLQAAFGRNLESGAAPKAAIRYSQGAASDEFGRYMDLLRGQSQLGLSGASALAGVGQNFGNTVTAGNQSAAAAAANARLYSGNIAANNWANIGSSFGNALGYLAR